MDVTNWPTLRGEWLTLMPTTRGDAEALANCADESTFAFSLGRPASTSIEDMARYLDAREAQPYTMRLRATGEVVGCSSFMDFKPPHRALEIGSTWITSKHRGTRVNPEAKLLMLAHAFEAMDCVRVQLKCDARNVRSAAAIQKLGAVFEGRLRNFGVMPDGYIRDTLMFSVTDAEWPTVCAGLEERLVG